MEKAMKKDEVAIGKTYVVKVSGKLALVRLDRVSPYGGWVGRNTRTGREIRIRSAAKLRRVYLTPEERRAYQQNEADLGGTV